MPDTILIEPVQYHTTEDIEAMLESIESQLVKLNQGNQRSRDMAQRMFQAILENPLQHAPQASCHAKAIIDRHTGGCRLTASDTGPGIRATLSRNPGLTVPDTDHGAIILATRKNVSSLARPGAGQGLHIVTEQAKLPGNHMTVRSMDGILIKLEDGSFDAGRAPRYPGTTIALTLKL